MTSDQYRKALARLNLTQGQAADLFGITIRSANAFANGRDIPRAIAIALRLMVRFDIYPVTIRD